MGNGMCSRKQKRIFQTLLLLTVVFGFLYGAMLYLELQTQLRKAEAVALKYQQHQDSLSAQLQVVYEHRSRLEKSLQKERLEHKKAKEDFLVYKLEAQETLNKGRQDSNSRYSALNVQHQMLKVSTKNVLYEQRTENFPIFMYDCSSYQTETVYNLREENKQLRKAHQDIHTQLQDVKTQVAEYKQLKDTLNRIPSFRNPDTEEHRNVTFPRGIPQGSNIRVKPTGELREVRHNQEAVPRRTEEKTFSSVQKEAGFQAAAEPNQVEPREPEEHQVEEEHRKALEEEEMEQVGQAEHLEEEHDPSPEEQDREWRNQQGQDAAHLLDGRPQAEVDHYTKAVTKFRSPYEEQLDQQRLAARRDEEAQRLREHQEALHQQRLHGHLLRQQQQQQLLAREMAQQKQAGHEEVQQHPEQLRQQVNYNAVENGIVQGAEDQGIHEEEGGAYERDNQHQDEAEGDPGNRAESHEPGHQEADTEAEADRAAVEDINPADDPNNQGEDEFEEAEQVREENLPEESEEQKQGEAKQENAEIDEHLVMAGNPDQQEDNVDEQYQEEGEEEVQEDLTEEKKRELEHNAEETYGENADDKNNDGEEQGARDDAHPKGREEHYEEEEEEEEDGAAVAEKSHRRAEM
uniref:Golgi integral membrane protein 4 n=1 Tax=Cricetulus griseus TaxID=10029 RepID=A0A8C2MJ82_CRIGR